MEGHLILKEAAKALGVHPVTLREWSRRGDFSMTKIGKYVYVPISEIERVISERIPEDHIKCNVCKDVKHLTEFHNNERRCKECMKVKNKRYKNSHKEEILVYNKEYREINKEKLSSNEKDRWENDKENQSDRHKMWRYGISKEKLQELKQKADGKCGLCGKQTKLYLDHDHETGLVREFLCVSCNTSLGKFNDDIELLKKVIEYIKKYKTCKCPNEQITLCRYGF